MSLVVAWVIKLQKSKLTNIRTSKPDIKFKKSAIEFTTNRIDI